MDAVFVSPLQLQRQPEESLDELNQSVKISKIFYKSHAIVNTFLLGGAFYQSSDLLSISALYFGWCGVVYGASSIDTNKKYLESQNLDAQRILSRVSVFQCTQACINLLAGVCLLAGGFAEAPEAGYTFGGLALATAVGNSFFFV